MAIRAVEMFFGFSSKSCKEAGEVEGKIACVGLVDAWTSSENNCSAERDTRDGQRQTLYA